MIISGFRSMVFLFTITMVFLFTETMGKVLAFYTAAAKRFEEKANNDKGISGMFRKITKKIEEGIR